MTPARYLFIIGAGKCGTTSLANWLGNVPGIVLGKIKESRYHTDFGGVDWVGPHVERYVDTIITDEQAYFDNFDAVSDQDWAIDASTDYLWAEGARERILAFSKRFEVRILCVLRDPIDRAFSQYRHSIRDNFDTIPLKDAITLEDDRRARNYLPVFYHARRSRYFKDVSAYKEAFGDKMMILDFQEVSDPKSCVAKVCDFLGVSFESANEQTNFVVKNSSQVISPTWVKKAIRSDYLLKRAARSLLPRRFLRRLKQSLLRNTNKTVPLTDDDRQLIYSVLKDDIDKCIASGFINTDGWRSVQQIMQNR